MHAQHADKPLLDVRNITRRFGGIKAVDDLSLHVHPNSIHGLIGPNGAGKTTTFNLISGFYAPTSGRILYGRVPAGSVVVSGTLPSPDGKYSLYCAVIVKTVDAKTRAKTSLNELLRGD